MATFLSPSIENALSEPQIANSSITTGAVLQSAFTNFTFPIINDSDTVCVLNVSVDAVPTSLQVACRALKTETIQIGLFKVSDGNTISNLQITPVDQDCFANFFDIKGGITTTEVLFQASATNINKSDSPLWEWAGLSERPDYDELIIGITAQSSGLTTTNGILSLKLEYLE